MALTTAQLLQKHMTTLGRAAQRGRKPTGCIAQVAKYEALRTAVQEEEPTLWDGFCKANKLDPAHTAYHLFNV